MLKRCILACLALACTVEPAGAAGLPHRLQNQSSSLSPVIHPSLTSPAGLTRPPARIWIRFTDRGTALGQSVPLSDRARTRRLLRGVSLDTPERQPVAPEYIDRVRRAGGRIHRISRWLNAVSVDYDPDLVRILAELPGVCEVLPVAGFRRQPEPEVAPEPRVAPEGAATGLALNYGPSLAQIQQITADVAHAQGYTGSGVLVAMFDTGFRKDHETFASILAEARLIAERDFVFDDGNVQNEAEDDPGAHNHGTSTWSTLGGATPGQLYGPAFGASFILAKTEDIRDETPVEEDNWMAAMEWADSLGADVISSSLSYSDWYTLSDYNGLVPITTQAANLAATLGIVVCNSAGNGGPNPRTIGAPVDGFYLISVGSVTSTGTISNFSSRGPTADGRKKPEVCARGSATSVASPASTTAYGTSNGTSFSCPLVGGCAALLLEAHPTWNPLMVREALMQTASNPASPDNTYGWGIVNTQAALAYAGKILAALLPWPDTLISYAPTHTLRVLASSLSPVDLAGSSLYYRVDGGGVTALPWAPGDTLTVALPAPSAYRSTVDFYVVIEDSVGFAERLPADLDSLFTMVWQTLVVGDLSHNLTVESADIVQLVNYIFKSGATPNPLATAEINGSVPITSADIIYLVNYVFKSGPPPVFPGS